MTVGQTTAVVVQTNGSDALVEPDAPLCSMCKPTGRCAGVSLARATCGPRHFLVKNPIAARVGDRVVLSEPAIEVVSLATLSYLFPLLGLLLGAALGSIHSAWLSVLLGVGGFSLVYLGLRFGLLFNLDKLELPAIVRNLSENPHSIAEGEQP